MNAAEIMTKRVITVRPDTSVGEIADLLLDHKVSAVPVIDNGRHVLGIVSEGDLLGHPPSGSPRAWWLRLFNDGTVRLEEIATPRHLNARDVMTKPVVTVVDQTPVDVLATQMRRRKVKRVPVLDLLEALMRRADAADECP
jgi:CBS domain-containing protein